MEGIMVQGLFHLVEMMALELKYKVDHLVKEVTSQVEMFKVMTEINQMLLAMDPVNQVVVQVQKVHQDKNQILVETKIIINLEVVNIISIKETVKIKHQMDRICKNKVSKKINNNHHQILNRNKEEVEMIEVQVLKAEVVDQIQMIT
jgi:hypothetical protein